MTVAFAFWGCIPETTSACMDMTNASSAYLGILAGAVIGAVISWLIYTRQEKTAKKQDYTLERIKELNERHEKMLETIEGIEERNKATLDKILQIEKSVAAIVKRGSDKNQDELNL
jgi:gas vesicle protein